MRHLCILAWYLLIRVCTFNYVKMNVHMKNIQIINKLNFKTMKKGLLTLLAASLVFVGCQNYDDQFDDLNAQISALKSQVDGLASLSGQVASLSGTISGLQAGVAAAQAASDAATAAANGATAAANAIDFSSLSAGLATLQAEVDDIQASLATAVTPAQITALETKLAAVQTDVTELLEGSGVYTTTLQITNQALLAAADALGNGINVISGGLNVAVTSDMNMTTLQNVINRVYNVTGNVTYTNALTTTQTAVTFDKLTSAADIQVEQKGAYSFATLTSASDIWLGDDNSDDVSSVNLGALTTVDNINTGESDAVSTADGIVFDQATSIDLGAMTFYTGGDLTFTTKTGGTLDIASLTDTNSAGTLNPFTLTVTGPASLSLTKLKGDDKGTDEGAVSVSKVATFSIDGFGGDVTVGAKVNNATIKDATADLTISAAVDLETLTVEGVGPFGKYVDNSASATTKSTTYTYASAFPSLTVSGSADDLTSVTLTGQFNVVNLTGQANLATVTANAKMETLTLSTLPDLATTALTGSTINAVTVTATGLTTGSLDYGMKNTAASTAVKYGSLSVTDNLDMTSLTSTVDDVATLTVTGNDKLTSISFANLNSIGTGATAAAANIYDNDLTAVKSTDTYDTAVAAAATKAHTTSDTGSYDNGTSGMGGLQTYLDAIVTAGTTATNAVFFDAVTTEVVGAEDSANDTTTTPGDATTLNTASWSDTAMATSAEDATQHFAVLYLRASSADSTTTYAGQVVDNQAISYSFQTNRNGTTLVDTDLGTNEGFTLTYATGLTINARDGQSYTSAANGSTIETIDDIKAYLNGQTTTAAAGTSVTASREGGEQTYFTVNYLTISGSAGAVATAGAGGQVNATFGSNLSDGAITLSHTFGAAFTEADLASALMADIDASNLWNAASVTTADGRANRFVVTANISQTGYGTVDKSPLAPNPPSLTILAYDNGSTTVQWSPSSFVGAGKTFGSTYSAMDMNADAIRNLNGSNTGSASGVVDLYVSKSAKAGLTVRLKNTGTVAFGSTVAMALYSVSSASASNTAIVTDGTVASTAGQGLLADGTNIISSSLNSATSGSSTTATTYWVASYASIGDGTPSTSDPTTAAVTCDRTSWLG